jgi:hypothetical protein
VLKRIFSGLALGGRSHSEQSLPCLQELLTQVSWDEIPYRCLGLLWHRLIAAFRGRIAPLLYRIYGALRKTLMGRVFHRDILQRSIRSHDSIQVYGGRTHLPKLGHRNTRDGVFHLARRHGIIACVKRGSAGGRSKNITTKTSFTDGNVIQLKHELVMFAEKNARGKNLFTKSSEVQKLHRMKFKGTFRDQR